ncbi:MAG TPA: class I SAM-dependent methyltransferase [Stellaceae bacterium]|nr:class I SAM-dependent methyltransferase [Stellaceae bacterium]
MSAGIGNWGGGYVTDIAYLPGYYRHQSPLHLNLACLLGGVAGIDIGPDTRLTCLELGCGQGFGALMLAACNPAWQVFGVDFNPAHIAAARDLAAEAGIANAQFLEADVAAVNDDPAWRDLPEADVVTLHGLWSWVGDGARAGIVRVLGEKLRPGGIAYVSYNALPAWQGALGMQRLLLEAGTRAGGSSDRQVAAGWELVRTLAAAKAAHLNDSSLVQALTQRGERTHLAYLAHEYMNAAWRPCFHADVVRALAPAKLDWVASAHLLENFTPLMLGEEARAALLQSDPMIRELVKDMFLIRSLRQDVFVRGARRLSNVERDAALAEVMLALQCEEAQFVWEFEVPAGQARFEREFFGPVVSALAAAPQRVDALLGLPGLPRRDNPGELVGMLVGSQQALPVLGPPTAPDPHVQRLNRAAAKRFLRPDNFDIGMALATSGTGSPLPCAMLDVYIADRLQTDGMTAAASWARDLGPGQPPEELARLREFIERVLAERAPVWRRLGVLPPAAAAAM